MRKRIFEAFGWRMDRGRMLIWRALGYLYGAWLTLRYVDTWNTFPAVAFDGEIVRLKITKAASATWEARGQLRVMRATEARIPCAVSLASRSTLTVERTFWIGPDVVLGVGDDAS